MPVEASFAPRAAPHEQAAGRLRQLLVENCIAPGAKLNERELCEVRLVLRTPLRKAIKMLAAEGLVDLLLNRGAIAVELSQTNGQHSFEVMAGLQAQAGDPAALRQVMSSHMLHKLQAVLQQLHARHSQSSGIAGTSGMSRLQVPAP